MIAVDVSHLKLEKSLDALRRELYSSYEPKVFLIDSIDVDTQGNVTNHKDTAVMSEAILLSPSSCQQTILPPSGMFIHTPIKINQAIFAMRSSLLAPWGKGRVIRVNTILLVHFSLIT